MRPNSPRTNLGPQQSASGANNGSSSRKLPIHPVPQPPQPAQPGHHRGGRTTNSGEKFLTLQVLQAILFTARISFLMYDIVHAVMHKVLIYDRIGIILGGSPLESENLYTAGVGLLSLFLISLIVFTFVYNYFLVHENLNGIMSMSVYLVAILVYNVATFGNFSTLESCIVCGASAAEIAALFFLLRLIKHKKEIRYRQHFEKRFSVLDSDARHQSQHQHQHPQSGNRFDAANNSPNRLLPHHRKFATPSPPPPPHPPPPPQPPPEITISAYANESAENENEEEQTNITDGDAQPNDHEAPITPIGEIEKVNDAKSSKPSFIEQTNVPNETSAEEAIQISDRPNYHNNNNSAESDSTSDQSEQRGPPKSTTSRRHHQHHQLHHNRRPRSEPKQQTTTNEAYKSEQAKLQKGYGYESQHLAVPAATDFSEEREEEEEEEVPNSAIHSIATRHQAQYEKSAAIQADSPPRRLYHANSHPLYQHQQQQQFENYYHHQAQQHQAQYYAAKNNQNDYSRSLRNILPSGGSGGGNYYGQLQPQPQPQLH